MEMIGIEFSSIIAQVLFVAMLLAIAIFVVWLVVRMKRRERLFSTLRRDNSKFRNEIANITGWTVEGRLPEDWQDKLHNHNPAALSPNLVNSDSASDPVLLAAHNALAAIDPPYFASNDSNETLEREHKRTVDLLETLAFGKIDPEPALANGDFDKLICMWRRLEAYFPDESETFAYGIASNVTLGLLKKKAIQVLAPRPLTVVNAKNCVLATDDNECLRDITRIRAAVQLTSSHLGALQPTEEIAVDCQRLGWNGPNGLSKPQILILDKSW